MEFPEWLRNEIEKRGWDQSELARRMETHPGTVGNVLTGNRQAGPDFCIAVARALGIPREDVFRARGWLLKETQPVAAPDADPRLINMAESVRKMPAEDQEKILLAWQAVLIASGKWNSTPYSSDLRRLIERSPHYEQIPRWQSSLWYRSIVYKGVREQGYQERIDANAGGTLRTYLNVDFGIVYLNDELFLDEFAQVNWGYAGKGAYTLAKFLLEHFLGEEPTIYVVGALAEDVLVKLERDAGWKITGRALYSWVLNWDDSNKRPLTQREEKARS